MKQEYIRKDHIITDMSGKVVFTGQFLRGQKPSPSINAAKRESRKLQTGKGTGGLGGGILRVAA